MDLLTVLLIVAGVVAVYLVIKKAQKKDEVDVETKPYLSGRPADDSHVQTSAKSAKAPKAKTSKK